MTKQKEEVDRTPDRERGRTPIAVRNILDWKEKEPGYVYRWVNQVEDRVPRFQEAGYEMIESEETIGDQRGTSDASKLASYVEKSVGGGTKAVLMRIKEEYYKQDQAEKQNKVDEIERSMDPRVREGLLKAEDAAGWEGGIHISRAG